MAIYDDIKSNLLSYLMSTSNCISTHSLLIILVYIISTVPMNVNILGKIKRLLKESEVL